MIVCHRCRHHNEDNDAFCGACGMFLDWPVERIAAAPDLPPPAPKPEPEPVHKSSVDRVKRLTPFNVTPINQWAPSSLP